MSRLAGVAGDVGHRFRSVAKARLGHVLAAREPVRVDLPPSHWGLATGTSGAMCRGDVDLQRLAREHGTPCHLVLADRLDANVDAARSAADGPAEVDVFYSYKTNPVPGVLRRLHDRGVGAEVISPYELWLALRLGVPGKRIIYNGPGKTRDSLLCAIEHGVLLINANSASEAALIARSARELRRTVRMGLRVNLPGMWGGQFGMSSTSPLVLDVVRTALAEPYVELRALHVHRGLTIADRETLQHHLAGVLDLCDTVRAATGWHPAVLDIGGSLPCPTVAGIPRRQFRLNRAVGTDLLPPDPVAALGLAEAAVTASQVIANHFRARRLPPPRVVIEPGRALTADTQLLLTTVLDVKDDAPLAHAVLDAGINVAEPVSGEYHQLFSVSAPDAPATNHYRLVGPTCTPADVLFNDWRLPQLEPGHVLAIMDSGAYFVPYSTTFSFPRPAVLIQEGGEVIPTRRAETFEDLVALDVLDEPSHHI